MSAGSTRIVFRVSQQLLAQIHVELTKHNTGPCNTPLDLSAFIRRAICNEIAKRRRSRFHRHPRKQLPEESWPEETVWLTDPPNV